MSVPQIEIQLGPMRLILLTDGTLWLSNFVGEGTQVTEEELGNLLRKFLEEKM